MLNRKSLLFYPVQQCPLPRLSALAATALEKNAGKAEPRIVPRPTRCGKCHQPLVTPGEKKTGWCENCNYR